MGSSSQNSRWTFQKILVANLAKSSCNFGYNTKLTKKKNLGAVRKRKNREVFREAFDEGSHLM
jgi:hypothetical protein